VTGLYKQVEHSSIPHDYRKIVLMNLQWDYNYYQPWSDNEWLVEEMLALLDKESNDVTIHC